MEDNLEGLGEEEYDQNIFKFKLCFKEKIYNKKVTLEILEYGIIGIC